MLLLPLAGTLAAADDGGSRHGAIGAERLTLASREFVGAGVTDRSGRIVNGTDSNIADIPWQVYIEVQVGQNLFTCGASAIAPRVLLTAAHCLFDFNGQSADGLAAASGVTDLRDIVGSDVTLGASAWVHPRYDPQLARNDIALVLMDRNLPGARTIKLYRSNGGPAAGTPALISGWGDLGNGNSPTVLQEALVQVLAGPGQGCAEWGGFFQPSTQLCIGVPGGGVGSCFGDSGGPAAVGSGRQVRVAGVTSFGGEFCAAAETQSVYTRVSKYHKLLTAVSYWLGGERDGRRASLAWEVPAADMRIVDYEVQYRRAGSRQWRTFADGRSTARQVTITGLNASADYQFRVIAVQKGGVQAPPSEVVRG